MQALVIGLGQFGMSLAQSLASHNVEVIAVDRRERRVKIASEFVAEALAFDAMDDDALQRLAPSRRDLCVCAVGDEAREASILITALLRQMGGPRVLARATDPLHARILRLVGAHEVVNPEQAFGARLAFRLAHRGVVNVLPLGADLVITELELPATMVGKTLKELELPRRHGITVVAIRRLENGEGSAHLPNPSEPLEVGDVLVTVSRPGAAETFLEGL